MRELRARPDVVAVLTEGTRVKGWAKPVLELKGKWPGPPDVKGCGADTEVLTGFDRKGVNGAKLTSVATAGDLPAVGRGADDWLKGTTLSSVVCPVSALAGWRFGAWLVSLV